MSTRSPNNDRYKVEQKGKTRKSASSSKPKRAVADITPVTSWSGSKPEKKKSTFWSRLTAPPAAGSSRAAMAQIESTPRMKQLRRIWWVLWGGALAIAVVILLLQRADANSPFVGYAWGFWIAAMGGAFYLEFVPIRRERGIAMEAARNAGKSGKKDKKKQTAGPEEPLAPAPDDTQPPAPEDPA